MIAMIRTKDIMSSLPLVASVLGDKYGVQVTVGGNKACTDRNNIILPTLPLDCSSELLNLARGFVDHEASHIRHTDFKLLQEANLTPTQKYLWNSLEDWRCENALAAIFPGCRQHFNWLIKHHFGQGSQHTENKAGDTNPALSVMNYVLLTVRAWDVPEIAEHKQKEAKRIQQAYPNLLPQIDAILSRVRQHCPDTAETIAYALELSATIEAYATQNPQQEAKKDSNDSASQSGDGPSTDSQAESQQTSKANGRTQRTQRTGAQQQLVKILQSTEDELPLQLGEQLAATLNAHRMHNSHGLVVATAGKKFKSPLPQHFREESLQNSVALRSRLHGLLQAVTQQHCVMGRRGKLNSHCLHKIAVNNPRIFLTSGEKKQVSTAVHILLDCSGSMGGCKMDLASRACYTVAMALEQCRGVNVGVTAFPAIESNNETTVAPLVRHGERVHTKFALSAVGYTPLAESLWWVMQQMLPLKEERKIILILSDGMPDSVTATKHALNNAKTLGFEVMGLGIQDNNLDVLLPPLGMQSRTIHNLPDLTPAMFGMLQEALLGRGVRA